jgi:hypothetical protein
MLLWSWRGRLSKYCAGENKVNGDENLHAFVSILSFRGEVKGWSEWDERHGRTRREVAARSRETNEFNL